MDFATRRIRTRRYNALADAVASLLAIYGVARPPREEFDVRTLATVETFAEFDVLRDFAVRLGDAEPVSEASDESVAVYSGSAGASCRVSSSVSGASS